jgi:hypothetical protein
MINKTAITNANRMKSMTMIPLSASSLRVVALNRKKIDATPKERYSPMKEKSNEAVKINEEKRAEPKQRPETFEYRIKERKHDPL